MDLEGVRTLRPDGRPSVFAPGELAELPWASAIVRPYAHTGGRTKATYDLAIEALIASSQPAMARDGGQTAQRRMIIDLCAQPRSLAEVAALMSVPLGVARVLVADLATDGMVIVHTTAGAAPDLEFMQRVLVGLRNL